MIKLFWLPGDREAIKNTVKLTSFFFLIIFYLIFSKIFFSSTKKPFSDFHFDRRNYFWSRANQQNIFNQTLSVFSSAACFCVWEIYEHFKFDGVNFLGPQWLWENCLENSQVFSNDPENELQIKGNSKICGPMTSSAKLLDLADSFFELGAELFFVGFW